MRIFILAALTAATAAASFATPSQAGGYGHRNDGYSYSQDYSYEPVCFIKKIRSYDSYGNLVVKKVRICR